MVRHADTEMTVVEEDVYPYSRSLETGGTACHARPHEEAPGLVGRQRGGRGEHVQSLYWGFHENNG